MTFRSLGISPVEAELTRALVQIAAGAAPHQIESVHVDIKEEPGRRGPGGAILPGARENERAAEYLAAEMACFANTPDGGAILIGLADDGTRIGTELDPQWLRHRLWQLTEAKLTVSAREVDLAGTRLLALVTHQAIEPIRYRGRLLWRVDHHCVDVDPTTWHAGHLQRTGVDWSAQPSGHQLANARPVALDIARRYLASGDAGIELADAADADLLRRLNLVTGDGRLTNAGSLLFVATPDIAIDYIHRELPGGDSTQRVRGTGPLIEQLHQVEQASRARNRLVHVPAGFAAELRRAIPEGAVREAIVNGVVHRDWLSSLPTTVEHVADHLIVTSPGGFIGGVAPGNIITHPSVPRYRSLAEAVAKLGLCEREGVGVDRMVRDMLVVGREGPIIEELHGPFVRISLLGGDPDPAIFALLAAMTPPGLGRDVDVLLLVDLLIRRGWLDLASAAPVLQRNPAETAAAIARLATARVGGREVVVAVAGTQSDRAPAHRFASAAGEILGDRLESHTTTSGRRRLAVDWARGRGRASSSEIADLTAISVKSAGNLLAGLEAEGHLAPGRPNRRGRGFFYVPAP